MSAEGFLEACIALSLALVALAVALAVARLALGPTLPDRVLALDMLTSLGIGFIAAIGMKTGYPLTVDIALALGLVGFLATIAFARFVLARGDDRDEEDRP